jgi:hypothetical protein
MGDVASSLFALGYHEKIDEDTSDIPLFVAELRRSCFARIYAADKSLAIFLGRPPRIMKEFCYFQLPTKFTSLWENDGGNGKSNNAPLSSPMVTGVDGEMCNNEQVLNYTSDTFCSALFAVIKEEILQLFRKRHVSSETSIIRSVAAIFPRKRLPCLY